MMRAVKDDKITICPLRITLIESYPKAMPPNEIA
jgi:hypothetical protein